LVESMKVGAHVFVSGRVQGVFFRVETKNEATKNNVTGWVRNTSDGRVEAFFEGEKRAVEKLVDFCRRGPQAANVSKIDVDWKDYSGLFGGFEIRRTHFI
jgi:acylphosphatase